MATTPSPTLIFYIASPEQQYVLEVQGTPSPGASVVAGPQSADAQNELWCVPGDGHIISRLDASLVLAPADASQGAGVVVQTLDATNQLQLWNVTSDGYIVSRQTGYVLTAPDTSGGQVVVEQQSGDPEAEQLWSLDVAGPIFGPPQVSYSTVLSEDYVGSNEVLVDAASENQVAMFRNPQTGAVEALVISNADQQDNQLFYLRQDATSTTGWNLDPVTDGSGNAILAVEVITAVAPWGGTVDAYYIGTGGHCMHTWLEGTSWVAPQHYNVADRLLKRLQVSYPSGISNPPPSIFAAMDDDNLCIVQAQTGEGWPYFTYDLNVNDAINLVPGNSYNGIMYSTEYFGMLVAAPSGQVSFFAGNLPTQQDSSHIYATSTDSWITQTLASYTNDGYNTFIGTADQQLLSVTAQHMNWNQWGFIDTGGRTIESGSVATRESDSNVNLYMVDTDANLGVLHQTGVDGNGVMQWAPYLPLDVNIARVYADPYPSDVPALFAVDGALGALHMHYQDPVTGNWLAAPVKLPQTDSYEIDRWRTEVSVFDANGTPLPGYPVTVSANSTCDLAVGTQFFLVGSDQPAIFATDVWGKLTLATLAIDLVPPTLSITVPGMADTSAPGAESPNPISVNYAGPVQSFLAGNGPLASNGSAASGYDSFTGDTLLAATVNGGPLAPGVQGDNPVVAPDAAVKYLQTITKMPSGTQQDGSGVAAFMYNCLDPDPARRGYQEFAGVDDLHAEMARLRSEGAVAEGILDDIWDWAGDVWRGITTAATKIAQVAVDLEQGVVHLWFEIKGVAVQVADWVVHTAEDAWHAVVSVFNWIETKIEDLIDWLKALFKFSDILDTATYFESLLGQVPAYFEGFLTQLGPKLDNNFFSSQSEAIIGAFEALEGKFASKQIGGLQDFQTIGQSPGSGPITGTTVSPADCATNVHHNWLTNQVSSSLQAGSSSAAVSLQFGSAADIGLPTWQDLNLQEPWDAFKKALEPVEDDIKQAFQDLANTVSALFQGDPKNFANIAITDILDAVKEALLALLGTFDALIEFVIALALAFVRGLTQVFNANLSLGLINTVYQWLAGKDAPPLTMASFCSLVAAFPATLIYKLMNSNQPPFPGGQLPDASTTGREHAGASEISTGGTCLLVGGLVTVIVGIFQAAQDCIRANPDDEAGEKRVPLLDALYGGGYLIGTLLSWPNESGVPFSKLSPDSQTDDLATSAWALWLAVGATAVGYAMRPKLETVENEALEIGFTAAYTAWGISILTLECWQLIVSDPEPEWYVGAADVLLPLPLVFSPFVPLCSMGDQEWAGGAKMLIDFFGNLIGGACVMVEGEHASGS